MDLKYPQWQEPLAEAICEFNPEHLRQKVQRAEEAIVRRIEELAFDPPNGREGQALVDGLELLRIVKKDRLGIPETKDE
jgi:hypothetical protein